MTTPCGHRPTHYDDVTCQLMPEHDGAHWSQLEDGDEEFWEAEPPTDELYNRPWEEWELCRA